MKTRFLMLLSVLILVAAPAFADSLNLTSSWTAWSSSAAVNPTRFAGPAFWNNTSNDGANCNIGFWLSGLGGCTVANTPGFSGDFYANSPHAGSYAFMGTGTSGFSLTADPLSVNEASVAVGVSALSGNTGSLGMTEFGWFPLLNRNEHHAIFSGAEPGTVTGFSVPSGDYGFYLYVRDSRPNAVVPSALFYSDQPDALGRTHFALFNLGDGRYVMGIEDKQGDPSGGNLNLSDYDYNDLAVVLQSTPVPEPTSALLLGVGLIGAAAVLRKRAKSAVK